MLASVWCFVESRPLCGVSSIAGFRVVFRRKMTRPNGVGRTARWRRPDGAGRRTAGWCKSNGVGRTADDEQGQVWYNFILTISISHYTKGCIKVMKINCVVCKKPRLDVSLREVLAFVQWLEKEHIIPVCTECTDRELSNLFLVAYAALKQGAQEEEQEREGGEQKLKADEMPFDAVF